jgi:hypothetical protein
MLITEDSFREMQESQKLMVPFSEFYKIFIKMVNSCIKEPHSFLAVFVMDKEKKGAKLDFIQNLDYKFIELLHCPFQQLEEEARRQAIAYRYNSVKTKL